MAETLKEVRRSLLDADVNYKIAKEFTNTVKEKALGMNVLTAVKPGQMMVKIVLVAAHFAVHGAHLVKMPPRLLFFYFDKLKISPF